DVISSALKANGRWDSHIAAAIKHLVGPNCRGLPNSEIWNSKTPPLGAAARRAGLVVDVGASIGYSSIWAATLGCRVIAFEPVPQRAALFQQSVWLNNLNNSITILETAVASHRGGALC